MRLLNSPLPSHLSIAGHLGPSDPSIPAIFMHLYQHICPPQVLQTAEKTFFATSALRSSPPVLRTAEMNQSISPPQETATLCEAYATYGENLGLHFDEPYAYCIADPHDGSLFISHDRFGRCPIYWFYHRGVFAFATELKTLLTHPSAPRNLSPIAQAKFFAYSLIPAPLTPIEGIYKLPAGCNMRVFPDQPPRITRYWEFSLAPEETHATDLEYADELRHLLTVATTRHLSSDTGIFLSGGVDSSTLAALAVRATGRSPSASPSALHSFSIAFDEPTYDESPYAARVAALLGTSHHCETVRAGTAVWAEGATNFAVSLDGERIFCPPQEPTAGLDTPIGDSSIVPTYLLCCLARRFVPSVLGGDGADELFAGYEVFRGLRAASLYDRFMPRPFHAALRTLAFCLPTSHTYFGFAEKFRRGMVGASYPPRVWNPIWLGSLDLDAINHHCGTHLSLEELYSEAITAWDSCPSKNIADRTLEYYTKINLPDGFLPKVTHAATLAGLEVRTPFLDTAIVEFARRLPLRYKLHKKTTKYILKLAMRDLLPADILHRPKQGFAAPINKWFREGGPLHSPTASPSMRPPATSHNPAQFLWCQLALQCFSQSLENYGR